MQTYLLQSGLSRDQYLRVILVLSALFLLMPLAAILGATVLILSQKIKQKEFLFFLFTLIAIYLGLINATKVPMSDQENYMNAYRLVPHQSVWDSLTNLYGMRYAEDFTTKEMGYGLLNIIGYGLSLGYYPLFIVEFTVLLYMLYFVSIYRFFAYLRLRNKVYYILSGVFCLSFFTQFFNLSIHLQRQEIATAIMIYALVDSVVRKKINWYLVIVGVLMHTSTGFFLPLFVMRHFLGQTVSKKMMALILVLCAVFTLGMNFIFQVVGGSLGGELYALERLKNAGTSGEERFDITTVLFFSLPLAVVALKRFFIDNKQLKKNEYFLYVSYLALILFAALNPDNTMQYRYFMMSYGFLPFLLPLLVSKQTWYTQAYLFGAAFFFTVRFFFTFDDIIWKYALVESVMLDNVVSLLLKCKTW